MKTAKIKSSKFTRKWDGDNGTVFYHDIELDNGDKGSIGTKEQDPEWLNVGQSLNYELTPSKDEKYPPKIKRVTDKPQGGGKPGGYQKEPFEEKAVASAYNQTAVLFSHKAVEEGKSFTLAQYIKSANEVYDAMLATAKRGRV